MYLNELLNWNKTKNDIFNKINESNIPVVLFGKTSAVDSKFLDNIIVEKKYIMDNDKEKWGENHWNLKVIDPNDCPYDRYNVLILVPFVESIVQQLEKMIKKPEKIFYLDLYFEQKNTAEYYEKNNDRILSIIDKLADEESVRVFNNVLKYRVNRNQKLLENINLPRNTQYFPKKLGEDALLSNDEIFVDAGAFIGDTVCEFIKVTGDKYNKVYAFEPDICNFTKIESLFKNISRINCYNFGVSDREGLLRFTSDKSSSKIDENGSEVVKVVSLDEILSDEPITYIKMDVEGMEPKALLGAQNIIKKYKPKLAICTYHSDRDMLEIPEIIMSINPDYKLYFRHYSKGIVETVCYAI